MVFDFKPLEKKVFEPKTNPDKQGIMVYPSANGISTAEYLVYDGNAYKKFRYNARKGYNDKAVFRLSMTHKEVKDVLCKKIVRHIIISLISFSSIKVGLTFENDDQAGMKKVFEQFVELVTTDYNLTILDEKWKQQVNKEYESMPQPSTSFNISSVSQPGEENYMQL